LIIIVWTTADDITWKVNKFDGVEPERCADEFVDKCYSDKNIKSFRVTMDYEIEKKNRRRTKKRNRRHDD